MMLASKASLRARSSGLAQLFHERTGIKQHTMSWPYKPGPNDMPTERVILVPHLSAFQVVELSPLQVACA